MDRFAIQTQQEIDQDPLLSEHGLQATFYQIPHAELELTMAIALEEQQPSSAGLAAQPLAAQPLAVRAVALKQIHFQPVNATYTNQFNFDVQASSKLKLTIVPVPPPAAGSAVTPNLTEKEVLDIAADKLAKAENVRLSVNFNGVARLWVVLQYQLVGDTVQRLALVVVDDETRQIIKAE
jgi:hypothetical protein